MIEAIVNYKGIIHDWWLIIKAYSPMIGTMLNYKGIIPMSNG